jgi:sugar phosphate permease
VTDQRDIAKDISIAMLSTSGLLVTLLVGLVTVSAPKGMRTGIWVSTIAFLICAIVNVLSLQNILQTRDDTIDRSTQRLILVGTILFCIGIGGLIEVILPLP